MLDFCAEHGIGATIETIDADGVDAAYDKVVDGRRALPLRHRRGDDRLASAATRVGRMPKDPAVLLAPGIWRIPLVGDFVNGFMFRDADDQVTLLDMGLKPSGKKVVAALRWIGSDVSDVTRLLLTHAHSDHAGGAAYVAEQTGLGFGVHADDADVRAVRHGAADGLEHWVG